MNNEQESDADQISDDDLLYRRFHYSSLRRDRSISYLAYMLPRATIPDPEISVNLARETTPEDTLAVASPVFGLGMLKVSDVRRLGFTVHYNPSRNNKAHCIIEGAKTEMDCRRLAEITQVYTLPPRK
jgi:hypothetical protein